uniref:Uncharacterized protein n=1 Tax=Rhizophora mucronata TaxID=61149 RepID=A0A2P2Q5F0_RHIMU
MPTSTQRVLFLFRIKVPKKKQPFLAIPAFNYILDNRLFIGFTK